MFFIFIHSQDWCWESPTFLNIQFDSVRYLITVFHSLKAWALQLFTQILECLEVTSWMNYTKENISRDSYVQFCFFMKYFYFAQLQLQSHLYVVYFISSWSFQNNDIFYKKIGFKNGTHWRISGIVVPRNFRTVRLEINAE